jgi:hypothetical protein
MYIGQIPGVVVVPVVVQTPWLTNVAPAAFIIQVFANVCGAGVGTMQAGVALRHAGSGSCPHTGLYSIVQNDGVDVAVVSPITRTVAIVRVLNPLELFTSIVTT